MIEIKKSTLEGRILALLLKRYPITVDEIREELHISMERVMRVIKALEVRGIIELEPLPDRVYVRLRRFDIHFIGRREVQRKALKHTKERGIRKHVNKTMQKTKKSNQTHDIDMMYA